MRLSRRKFLKSLVAASSLALLPAGALLVAKGLVGDVYYMTEGEILDGVNQPPWSKIVAASNCVVKNCNFIETCFTCGAGVENVVIISCRFDNSPWFGATINTTDTEFDLKSVLVCSN